MSTIAKKLYLAVKEFQKNPLLACAKLDAEILLAFVLKKNKEFIFSHPEFSLDINQEKKFHRLIQRRLLNEPIAYIIGKKEFFCLDFLINKNTLIPRPETELIVEKVLKYFSSLNQTQKTILLDIGTGSGCIAISLAKKLSDKNYSFFASDNSPLVLKNAKKNASLNKVAEKLTFLSGDLLLPFLKLKKTIPKNYLLIITANLPYVSKKIYENCPLSVRNFEPKNALISGIDGLDHYRKLLYQIKKAGIACLLFCEISPEQKELILQEIKKRFSNAKINFYKDLANLWRVAEIKIIPNHLDKL